MKIDDDHFYYGAAVIQIAEHPEYSAIDVFKDGKTSVECAYVVNHEIGLYVKYRGNPDRSVGDTNEYHFHFNWEARGILRKMEDKRSKLFLAFVCVKDREICVLSYKEFQKLYEQRVVDAGDHDEEFILYVEVTKRKSLRAFVVPKGRRGLKLPGEVVVPRNAFPSKIFDDEEESA